MVLVEEEEEFYRLDSPSLDYAIYDASQLRFLDYPQTVAVEPTSLAGFSPTVRRLLLSFLLSR